MRILLAGTPEVAVPALAALLASEHQVVGVLTRADAPTGRGRKLTPSPVRVAGERAGLPVITTAPSEPGFAAQIAALGAEVAAVVAYGHLLKPEVLALLPHGWLNLHFSLLPKWRGAAPVQHAIRNGDTTTGASVFLLDPGMDTGPVYATLTEPLRAHDTTGSVLERLAISGAELLVRVLSRIEHEGLQPHQQVGVPSLAPKLSAADAQVDWTQPAPVIDRLIRSCTPAPGAWTYLPADARSPSGACLPETTRRPDNARLPDNAPLPAGKRLGLAPIELRPDVTDLAPGQVRAGKRVVLVGTGTGAVALGQVRPVGKQPMMATDWARGARLPEGVTFQ